MQVSQINSDKTPWLFNPAFDTGEVDAELNPVYIYDALHLEEAVASGKKLRKKCKDYEQSCHLKEDSSVDVYRDDELVATWQIIPQYWQNSQWNDYTKVPTSFTVTPEGRLQCEGSQGGFSWDIDIGWTRGDSKWSINVVAPGILFRFKWNIVFTTLGQELIADGSLKLGFEDYPGDTEDDLGIAERNIIFEPLGIDSELTVDPYLFLTEASTTVNIKTDVAPFFEIEFDEGVGGNIREWYQGDGGSTRYSEWSTGLLTFYIRIGASTYYEVQAATSSILTVLYASSTVVKLRAVGELSNTSNYDYEVYWTIYASGHIFFDFKFTNNTGASITDIDIMGAVSLRTSTPNYSSTNLADNTNDTTPAYNTEYWFGQYHATLKSVFCAVLDIENSKAQQNTYYSAANAQTYSNQTADQVLADGDSYRQKGILYITGTDDTATEVEASLGQWHPQTASFATIADSLGDLVTDLNIPSATDSAEGMYADGAQHVDLETSTHDAKYLINQTEINRVDVLHSPSIRTGDGSTEHVVGHWKCDDNAASTTVVDSFGSYDGTLVGGDNTSVLSNTDAVRGKSLLLDGTAGYIDLTSAIAGLTSTDKFTIKCSIKPDFDITEAGYPALISFGSGSADFLYIYYDSSDRFKLSQDISNANGLFNITDQYVGNADLQVYHTFIISVDLTHNLIVVQIGTEMLVIEVSQEWAVPPDFFYIGRKHDSSGLYCPLYVDEITLIDGCILPYGTHLSAQQVDSGVYTDAHSDILVYWKGSDCTSGSGDPIQIGGTNGAIIGSGSFITSGGPGNGPYFDNTSGATNRLDINVTGLSLSLKKGSTGFWVNLQNAGSNDGLWGLWYDNDNYIAIFMSGIEAIVIRYRYGGLTAASGALAIPTSGWVWVSAKWKDNSYSDKIVEVTVNNHNSISIASFGTMTSSPPTNLRLGHIPHADTGYSLDAWFGPVTITDEIGTPQLPFCLGHGPIEVPKVIRV